MKLEKFRVTHFRNVHDSGWIDLAHTTALLGRNESGKTNLLTALSLLVADGSEPAFSRIRDFPADRPRSEYDDDLPVIQTRWRLTADERDDLAAILPESQEWIEVERRFVGGPIVRFGETTAQPVTPADDAKELAGRLEAALIGEAADDAFGNALNRVVESAAHPQADREAWGRELQVALRTLEITAREYDVPFDDATRGVMDDLSALTRDTSSNNTDAAAHWVLNQLPIFVYLDDLPELEGRIDLRAFSERRRNGTPAIGDHEVSLLLQLAGIDDEALAEIFDGDSDQRRQVIRQAGAAITRRIRQLWTDRPLKIRFHLDGDRLSTLVCDPSDYADIEVNLDQRSRGFRWFFSFFVFLCASREHGGRSALLLLDEPGLHLHPVAQRDLIQYLCEIESAAVLTTQSSDLVPSGPDAAVLTVQHDLEEGTSVVKGSADVPLPSEATETDSSSSSDPTGPDPTGDPDAIEAPAKVASPADDDAKDAACADATVAPEPEVLTIEQGCERVISGLFGEGPLLLVEHLSDFWYLRAASNHLIRDGRCGLPEGVVPVPAGGAAHLGLLAGIARHIHGAPIVVVGSRPHAEMARAMGEPEAENVAGYVFHGDAHEHDPTGRTELEDLIEPAIYDRFVHSALSETVGDPALDPQTPNVVTRWEQAMAAQGETFVREAPARLIANDKARNVRTLMSGATGARMERLFELIRDAVEPNAVAPAPDEAQDETPSPGSSTRSTSNSRSGTSSADPRRLPTDPATRTVQRAGRIDRGQQ